MAGDVSGKAIVAGALSGIGAIGTFKLIEALTKKVEAGEIVVLDTETLALLAAMVASIEETSKGVAVNAAGVSALLGTAGAPPIIGQIELIPFSHTLTPGETLTLREYAPFAGYLTFVTIHWPDGCNARVDVAVVHGLTQFCPREGWLFLNDITPTYEFGKRIHVDDHEEIKVMLQNRGAEDHTITTTVIIEEG